MTDLPAPNTTDVDAFAILAHGAGSVDHEQARRALGLDEGCDDAQFAQAVVRHVARGSLPLLRDVGTSSNPPAATSDEPNARPRASFMLRLPATISTPGLSVNRLDDVRTLLLMMRAGGLFQRRAAVLRMGELLAADAPIASDSRKRALDTLNHQRRSDVGYEAGKVLAALSGAEGRAARADRRLRNELATLVESRVLAFWEGEASSEPFSELSAEERALLLPRGRELSELLSRHLSALIEGGAGTTNASFPLRVLVMLLQHAGDPRLLPALRSMLYAQDTAVFEPCLRALANIDDPRVPPLLRDAYDRATRAEDRLRLAGALGVHGDARGLAYVRTVLAEKDPTLMLPAVEALAELGGSDDLQGLVDLLEHDNPQVVRAAVVALGRTAHARALVPLSELRSRVSRSALRADIEEAESAVIARTELLGEDPRSINAASLAWDTRRMVARVRTRDPAWVRARARLYHGAAYVWLVLGAVRRAAARFEAAAVLRPGWMPPVLALAMLHARSQDVAQALAAFRRALDIDRAMVEVDAHAVTALAKAFLRRAEAMEREGRLDIARGLIEEALSYDLRRARAEIRLALTERRDAHRMRER